MQEKYKSHAKYAVDNFQVVLDDLEENKKRMMSGVFEEQDYNNIPVFAFANYVKPADRIYTLSYRLFMNVTPGNELSGLEILEGLRKQRRAK